MLARIQEGGEMKSPLGNDIIFSCIDSVYILWVLNITLYDLFSNASVEAQKSPSLEIQRCAQIEIKCRTCNFRDKRTPLKCAGNTINVDGVGL